MLLYLDHTLGLEEQRMLLYLDCTPVPQEEMQKAAGLERIRGLMEWAEETARHLHFEVAAAERMPERQPVVERRGPPPVPAAEHTDQRTVNIAEQEQLPGQQRKQGHHILASGVQQTIKGTSIR